ncbi:outer membrane protein assembly factor [Rhodobacteraceae bacterium RKSG542]|nr:outer membrane protein assembly factor [Pseudovibrio flavus]
MAFIACTFVAPYEANAFSLFGFHLWGEKEPDPSDFSLPDPTPYTVTFTVEEAPEAEDKKLVKKLENSSQLVSQVKNLPSGVTGLKARALSDFEQLVARLYAAGHYGGLVSITIDGVPLQQSLEDPKEIEVRPVPVNIVVKPGPLFTFGTANVTYAGPVTSEDRVLPDASSLGIVEGEAAFSAKVLSAEKAALKAMADKGYPKAQIAQRSLVADHNSNELDVTLRVESGRKAFFGPVTVVGATKVDPEFIKEYALIPEGKQFDGKLLQDSEQRLRDLEVFASLRIQPIGEIQPDGTLPIQISVAERPEHVFGFGANWSSNEGIGVEGYWRHRNLFGQAEKLQLSGSVGNIDSAASDDLEYDVRLGFEKPGAFGPTTSFTSSLGAKQENPDNYRSRSISSDFFFIKQFDEFLEGRLGGELYFANEEDVFGMQDYFLLGVPGYVVYDDRNDKLNPTKGTWATAFVEPAYDAIGNSPLLFSRLSVTGYLPIGKDDRFVLAGRAATGSIVAERLTQIPAARRFYLGGGGTVRGYAYKNIGPRIGDDVTGGRSFMLFNGELRARVTDNFGVVGFIDAGAAYDPILPNFSEPLKVGVGGGIRYYTPVGPLRLDIGVPLEPDNNDPSFALYVGIGQAF